MNSFKVPCFSVFFAIVCCMIAHARFIDNLKEQIRRQYLCKDEKMENRDECLKIMSQPALQQSYNYLMNGELEKHFISKRNTESAHICENLTDVSLMTPSEQQSDSFSPFIITPQCNSSRIPRILWEARCKYTYCVDPNTETRIYDKWITETVYKTIRIYVRGPRGRTCKKIPLAVGCTCTMTYTVI